MALSKPELGRRLSSTFIGCPALTAASTRQAATPVAPFQLAYTVLVLPARRSAPAGAVLGRPSHGAIVARYVRSGPGSSPSKSSFPERLYSEKYGSEPQPTKT